jgi:fibronectin type 3 domain-containing protein
VQLVWAPVAGATSYNIYRSTVGPNTGFSLIAQNVVTSYATYLDSPVVIGTTYYYRVVANSGCGSKAVAVTPTGR